MNAAILVTSIGAKIPLMQALKRAKENFDTSLKLIGADTDPRAQAAAFVDIFWQMPPLPELGFDTLLSYVQEQNIRYIIPSRDGELPFFAQHKQALKLHGIEVFVADAKAVAFCYDKLHFYQNATLSWAIETSLDSQTLHTSRFVVKERFGAGAKSMASDVSKEQALTHAIKLDEPIFQPFVQGKEYSIDCYVDKKMACRAVVVRSRDVVVDGESQVTTTVHDTTLAQKAAAFVTHHKIQGHSVLQVLQNENGSFLIECNARFGGASTLSEYMGLKSFLWFLQEANDIEIDVQISQKIITQVRKNKEDNYFEN
ncbi:MAG: ATP-grasp domain-containing protein [Sulfurimonas sp.]|nr:ATP-grasp domain-containing protein [Sulfurimonas sp.]